MITNPEVQELLSHCHGYAADLLMETGELFPFGASMDASGRTSHREYEIDLKKIPSNGEIIEKLLAVFEEEFNAGELKAYALVYEVRIKLDEKTTTDAFAIDIKHRESEEIPVFYYPFTIEENENVVFGENFAVKRGTTNL
jgi:hypothetical protein